MIVLKINCSKIPKDRLFKGQQGSYLDVRLVDNPDQYGNAGFVAIDLPKEAREAGEKGEIIGNWKEIGQKRAPAPIPQRSPVQTKRPPADPDLDASSGDDCPF